MLLLSLFGLLAIHGLFVAAEFALVSVETSRKRKESPHQARLRDVRALLSTCQIGRTAMLIVFGMQWGQYLGGTQDAALSSIPLQHVLTVVVVFMFLVLGIEWPKMIGVCRPQQCANVLAPHLQALSSVLYPIDRALRQSIQQLTGVMSCWIR